MPAPAPAQRGHPPGDALDAVLNTLPAAIALLDATGVILLVNRAWRAFSPGAWMTSPAPGVGQDYPGLCEEVAGDAEADARAVARCIRSVLRGDAAQASHDYPCGSHAGEQWFRMTATASCGNSPGAVVTHADITEGRQAARENDHGQRLLQTLVDALPDVVYTRDVDGRFVHGNQACLARLDFDHERELAGKSASDIWPPEIAAGMQADDQLVLGGRPVFDRGTGQQGEVELPGLHEPYIGTYLTYAGASVERSPDLAAASEAGQAPGRWLWLILPSEELPPLDELRTMAPDQLEPGTRFIAVRWGRRRRPRMVAVDLVTRDAGTLFRRTLFELLALASGRIEEQPADESSIGAAALPRPALQREQPAQDQSRPILIAEDNETDRQVVLRQLRLIGWDAEVAVNGREALERWRNGDFALLLTDVHMPELDGYALAAAIRAEEPAGRRMPIVALTANALRDEELRCRAAGVDAYLSKPVRLVSLKGAIDRWIGSPPPALVRSDTPIAPVDLKVLAELIGDDAVAIDEVLQSFQATASQSQRSLAEAVASGSLQVAADTAHSLKSAARAIGAIGLGDCCAVIEQMARAGKSADLRAFLPQFQAEMKAVRVFLESRQQVHR